MSGVTVAPMPARADIVYDPTLTSTTIAEWAKQLAHDAAEAGHWVAEGLQWVQENINAGLQLMAQEAGIIYQAVRLPTLR